MYNEFFHDLEHLPDQSQIDLGKVLDQLYFNDDGLIPVITQDAHTKDILMFAWMNKTSLQHTLDTQKVTYWSRSRQKLWVKGESSGHTQKLISMTFDCDGDTVLCQVEQSGPACHTGRPSCFYLRVDDEKNKVFVIGDAPDS